MAIGGTAAAPNEGLHGRALAEALIHEKGVRPIRSADDLACAGAFDTDAELTEFLTWVATERRTNLE